MPKTSKRLAGSAERHVLGDRAFAAITAVEGIGLSATSLSRLASMRQRNLSAQEQRDEVIRAYSEAKLRR